MGLAPFFEKTALAGAQLLRDFDTRSFARMLESQVAQVAFDAAALQAAEGRVTLEMTVNLLSRLYPRLLFTPLDAGFEDEVATLAAQARSINPHIEILNDSGLATLAVVIGTTLLSSSAPTSSGSTIPTSPLPTSSTPTFYLGSDGWIAGFSTSLPVGSGRSANPFAAAAIACWGVANLFRATFHEQLLGALPDSNWRVSLLDLDRRGDDLTNPVLDVVDIGESHLVGVGAIGNATVWALSRAPFLQGTLHLVDNEAIDHTNPQRYVLTTAADIGARKVILAKGHLETSPLMVEAHDATWSEYLERRGDWILERLLVALDTPEDRCAVQTALPRRILNAWTQPEDLGVSRHGFANGQACLMCLYIPEGQVPDLDDQILKALNLMVNDATQDDATLREVRQLLVTGEPIGLEWVQRIASANHIPEDSLLELQNLPLISFYQKAICGGVLLSLGASPDGSPKSSEVPMAFQSALAGILLAVELVADAAGLRSGAQVTTKVNLLRPLGQELSLPAPQHRSGHCICQDNSYIRAYNEKYPDANQ